jgi:AcrR family transcriptional regulator
VQNNPKAKRWLNEGKKRFANEGVQGINIKEMANSIGVAKTSFYFHFKTKQEYLRHLFEFWVEDGSNRIINKVAIIDDPYSRFRKLMEFSFNNIENDKFLFHIREYAQGDKYAASVLKKVENSRLKFLNKIFAEMGCSASVAKKKSKDVYMFYLGFFELHKHNGISPKLRKETVNDIITQFDIKK